MALPQPSIPYEPQQTNLLGQVAQAQQLQSQGVQLQMQKLALRDQVNLRASAQGIDWTAPNAFDTFLSNAQQKGVSPQTLSGMALQRQQYLEQVAKTDDATNKLNMSRNNQLLGHIDAIKSTTDPAQRAQVAQAQAQQILAQKLDAQLDPQTRQVVQATAAGKYVPDNGTLDMLSGGLLDHNTQIENKLKTQQIAQSVASTNEATAKTAVSQAELPGTQAESQIKQQQAAIGTPQLQEAQYRAILQKKASGQALTPLEVSQARAYEASQAKTTTQSDSLGVTSTNTSRPAGLAALGGSVTKSAPTSAPTPAGQGAPPAAKQNVRDSIVDMIGQYRADPTLLGRMTFRHPEIIGQIMQKYPDFDQTNYVAKNQMMQKYTSGPQSKEINAINTVAGHLSVLNDAIDALNNGNVGIINKLANKVGAAVGQTPQTTFQTIVNRIGPEITTAYVQGGGGEAERFANAEDFSVNKSPQQLKQNVGVTVQLLRSKIGALENQYKNTVGRDDFQQRFITPDAAKSFNRLAPQGSSPQGGGEVTATGPNGHKIIVRGGKWVDAQTGQPIQ